MSKVNQQTKPATAFKPATVTKGTGIVFIILSVIITLVNKCPTNVQYFIIYALIGVGIALLFAKSAERTTANVTIQNMGIVLGGSVALPFILFFTNPIGTFKSDACTLALSNTGVTVFVHGKKGKQDIILRQKGYVMMDVGGERKRAMINDNGQAFFQNLHAGDSVRLDIDFTEPYRTIYPDSVYVIKPNNNIYLPIALQGIDKVQGRVLYKDDPLAGVTVQVDTLSVISDSTGRFSIVIPEALQKDNYKVWFTKKGFRTKSATATPQIGDPLEILMEK